MKIYLAQTMRMNAVHVPLMNGKLQKLFQHLHTIGDFLDNQ